MIIGTHAQDVPEAWFLMGPLTPEEQVAVRPLPPSTAHEVRSGAGAEASLGALLAPDRGGFPFVLPIPLEILYLEEEEKDFGELLRRASPAVDRLIRVSAGRFSGIRVVGFPKMESNPIVNDLASGMDELRAGEMALQGRLKPAAPNLPRGAELGVKLRAYLSLNPVYPRYVVILAQESAMRAVDRADLQSLGRQAPLAGFVVACSGTGKAAERLASSLDLPLVPIEWINERGGSISPLTTELVGSIASGYMHPSFERWRAIRLPLVHVFDSGRRVFEVRTASSGVPQRAEINFPSSAIRVLQDQLAREAESRLRAASSEDAYFALASSLWTNSGRHPGVAAAIQTVSASTIEEHAEADRIESIGSFISRHASLPSPAFDEVRKALRVKYYGTLIGSLREALAARNASRAERMFAPLASDFPTEAGQLASRLDRLRFELALDGDDLEAIRVQAKTWERWIGPTSGAMIQTETTELFGRMLERAGVLCLTATGFEAGKFEEYFDLWKRHSGAQTEGVRLAISRWFASDQVRSAIWRRLKKHGAPIDGIDLMKGVIRSGAETDPAAQERLGIAFTTANWTAGRPGAATDMDAEAVMRINDAQGAGSVQADLVEDMLVSLRITATAEGLVLLAGLLESVSEEHFQPALAELQRQLANPLNRRFGSETVIIVDRTANLSSRDRWVREGVDGSRWRGVRLADRDREVAAEMGRSLVHNGAGGLMLPVSGRPLAVLTLLVSKENAGTRREFEVHHPVSAAVASDAVVKVLMARGEGRRREVESLISETLSAPVAIAGRWLEVAMGRGWIPAHPESVKQALGIAAGQEGGVQERFLTLTYWPSQGFREQLRGELGPAPSASDVLFRATPPDASRRVWTFQLPIPESASTNPKVQGFFVMQLL